MPLDHKCECSARGFCKKFNRSMTTRDQAICSGAASGISEADRASYINKWSRDAGNEKIPSTVPRVVSNPRSRCLAGTELKKLLAWFGQTDSSECACNSHAATMDSRGCEWCEQNIDIILGWLTEEASKRKVFGFSLDQVPGFDMTAKALIGVAVANARKAAAKAAISPFSYSGEVPRFISLGQLGNDARRLASMIPSDAKGIIGIARSGLTPATMIAQMLHLPLKVLRQHLHGKDYSIEDAGSGWRLTGNTGGRGPWVIVDDTVMSGNSFRYSMPAVAHLGEVITAAVYVNPHARIKPDLIAVDLPWPHLLEWNMFNSVMTPSMAVDFDGILCHDCPGGSDDDGPRYLEFLRNTKPLYPVRKIHIPLIVTARLEKYRGETVDWLSKHGMAANRIVMGPWKNLAERSFEKVCQHKARHFVEFARQRHPVKPPMFVESCPHQARRIADISGGLVVCPAAGRCFLKGVQ